MRFPALTFLAAALPLAAAQQPPATSVPPAGGPFRVSVNLVQVEAVVTDSQGHHVAGLQPEDFAVTEDGKPQKITNFSWIEVEPPHGSQESPVRRAIVLMIDDAGLWAEHDALPVMTAAHKFIADEIGPGDLVSVIASRGGMGFYQSFTSDKRQLNAAIDRIAQRPGFGRWTVAPPEKLDDSGLWMPIALAPGEPRYGYRDGETPRPIAYLTQAILGLQHTPGRKAVVLFSHSFAAPPSLVDLANRAGVAIYVIDPHGRDLAVEPRLTPHGVQHGVTSPVIAGNAPYRTLAAQTGGLFILSSPGANLNQDLHKVLEDLSGYYLLGYQAGRDDLELSEARPAHHDIQVKVRRRGLTVRARSGFAAAPEATPSDSLRQALFSPFNAGKIRVRVDPTYAASPPDPATRLRQPLLRALLQVEGRDVQFTDTPDGNKKLTYTVVVAVFHPDGRQAAIRGETFTSSLTTGQAAQVATYGIHATMDLNLAAAGPYQIRAAVRDENSGSTGSAYSFLDVPDFNKPQIALSSIELQGDGTGWHQYSAGASVQFECEVLGVRMPPQPPGEPRVDMQIRLFREGAEAPVFDSHVIPVPSATLSENFLAGSMRIGSNFAPGDYTLQLLAYDRLASPKKQVATQWTSLTVVRP